MTSEPVASDLASSSSRVGFGIRTFHRPTKALPQILIDSARVSKKESFDPKKHLDFRPPAKILSMKDIGYEGKGISPNAVSEPFPLFTPGAIKQMRAEVFSPAILDKCQYTSKIAGNMIRGFGPSLAPFTFDAWHSPEILEVISNIAGIDLVPALEFDVGHINISIDDRQTEAISSHDQIDEDGLNAFGWHFDSYPFVCITMISDCEGMSGGETALRTATGDILKVRGPTMGTAVVMQGRYIEHQALKAYDRRERITMVTSFRPKSALVKDETVLDGVRDISYLPQLYGQYTSYRLGILEERIRTYLEKLQLDEQSRQDFDVNNTRQFLIEQQQFMEAMLVELI